MDFFCSDVWMLATVNFLALLSPGPNFAMIVQHSLTLSRVQALSVALGIATAGYIHQCIVIVGLGVIISQSPLVMKIIHFSGILYLGYLGFQSLQLKNFFSKNEEKICPGLNHTTEGLAVMENSLIKGFLKGFIFNILNPVSLLFFLGLFSSSVHPQTPQYYRFFYALLLAGMDLAWYSLTALVFSHGVLQKTFLNHRLLIDRITGIILLTVAAVCLYEV